MLSKRQHRGRERNQHRRTHELQQHSANRARIEAERADMEARWRATGKLFQPRHQRVGSFRRIDTDVPRLATPSDWSAALLREVRA